MVGEGEDVISSRSGGHKKKKKHKHRHGHKKKKRVHWEVEVEEPRIIPG